MNRISRWKPGSIITFTGLTASSPSRGWAKFAQHAPVEAANDWISKEVGLQFRLANPGDRAVFALKYHSGPSWVVTNAFAPDSENKILYVFHASLKRGNRKHLSTLFRHELGHILGLRREDTATREPETPPLALTAENSRSIMNYCPDFDRLAQLSIQDSDVEAVRKLCSIDQATYQGFEVITVDPDALYRASFDSSDRLSSIDSEILSTYENLLDVATELPEIAIDETGNTMDSEQSGLSDPPGHSNVTSDDAISTNAEVPLDTVDCRGDQRDAPGTTHSAATEVSAPDYKQVVGDVNKEAKLSDDLIGSKVRMEVTEAMGSDTVDLDLEDAFTPEPGTEDLFCVENYPFAFSPGQLRKSFNPKSLSAFWALGGLAGLERGLRTDRVTGLSIDKAKLDGFVPFEDAATKGTSKYGALGEKLAWETYYGKIWSTPLTLVSVGLLGWGFRWDLLPESTGDKSGTGWREGVAILLFVIGSVATGLCCRSK